MSFAFLNPRSPQAVLDSLMVVRIVAERQLVLALAVVVIIIHRGAGAP
ncbi:MAG: hypothetical protein Q8O00_07765 [Holophaga sp.]|nr:hypothetical protein [Holophaga sp.]